MNPSIPNHRPADTPPVAWWRVPQMWLVVGGPLVVVVASLVTAWIAVRHADPVIDKAQIERERLEAAEALRGQARQDALIQLQPAHQARNHAASPVVPKED